MMQCRALSAYAIEQSVLPVPPLLHGITGQLLKSVLMHLAKFKLISEALINSPDLNIFIISSLEFSKIHTQIRKKVN